MLEPNKTYVIEDDGSIHRMRFCGDADWEERATTSIQEIINQAIDELKNKICMHFADWQYSEDDKWIKDIIELASESVEEIAEQMKEK